jgi:hypothetical protein
MFAMPPSQSWVYGCTPTRRVEQGERLVVGPVGEAALLDDRAALFDGVGRDLRQGAGDVPRPALGRGLALASRSTRPAALRVVVEGRALPGRQGGLGEAVVQVVLELVAAGLDLVAAGVVRVLGLPLVARPLDLLLDELVGASYSYSVTSLPAVPVRFCLVRLPTRSYL